MINFQSDSQNWCSSLGADTKTSVDLQLEADNLRCVIDFGTDWKHRDETEHSTWILPYYIYLDIRPLNIIQYVSKHTDGRGAK